MLDIYDEQLVSYGEYIINKRLEYLNKLNYYGKKIHNDITSQKEEIEFKYQSAIKDLNQIKISFDYLLKNSRKKDFEKGITTVGPHRDDFSVYINNIETKSYGSQGQQRTAVLTMKFSSLRIIKEVTGEYPILLLDDVLSELDFNRKRYVLSCIGDIQTIITCTGSNDIKDYLDSESKIFTVSNGIVSN
jgi:DNA replication and repair protein RecF